MGFGGVGQREYAEREWGLWVHGNVEILARSPGKLPSQFLKKVRIL